MTKPLQGTQSVDERILKKQYGVAPRTARRLCKLLKTHTIPIRADRQYVDALIHHSGDMYHALFRMCDTWTKCYLVMRNAIHEVVTAHQQARELSELPMFVSELMTLLLPQPEPTEGSAHYVFIDALVSTYRDEIHAEDPPPQPWDIRLALATLISVCNQVALGHYLLSSNELRGDADAHKVRIADMMETLPKLQLAAAPMFIRTCIQGALIERLFQVLSDPIGMEAGYVMEVERMKQAALVEAMNASAEGKSALASAAEGTIAELLAEETEQQGGEVEAPSTDDDDWPEEERDPNCWPVVYGETLKIAEFAAVELGYDPDKVILLSKASLKTRIPNIKVYDPEYLHDITQEDIWKYDPKKQIPITKMPSANLAACTVQ